MDTILVVNAGSSSVKFQVFAVEGERQLRAADQGPDRRHRQPAAPARQRRRGDSSWPTATYPIEASSRRSGGDAAPPAHGCATNVGSTRWPSATASCMAARTMTGRCWSTTAWSPRLERYRPLAPLHQPHNLAPIRSMLARLPGRCRRSPASTPPSTAATARSPTITRFRISFYAEGVRRYGFHGLSYEYIAQRLPQIAPDIAKGRVIVAHLGSGASMCALQGRAQRREHAWASPRWTGCRWARGPGQLDPGVVLYLMSEKGMTRRRRCRTFSTAIAA